MSVAAHQRPVSSGGALHPTVQGFCLLPASNELYCSEYSSTVTVRSSIPSTKFVVKGSCELPCCRHDAVIRCIHYPGLGDWLWCAASSGELFGVNRITKKYTSIADSALLQDSAPILAIGDLQLATPLPPATTPRRAVSTTAVVVTVSRVGAVSLWDAVTRTRFHTLRLGLTSADPTHSALQLLAEQHMDHKTPTAASHHVRCMVCWSEVGIAFFGMSDGGVVVLDARGGLRSVALSSLPLPAVEGAVLCMDLQRGDAAGAAALSSPVTAKGANRGTLWLGCASGGIAKVQVQLSSGASSRGPVLVLSNTFVPSVHSGSFCHKIKCAGEDHVITCGGDTSVVIVDADTCNLVQRVTLENQQLVQEAVVLGEHVRGAVSVLLALSDRSLRLMGVKCRRSGVRYAAPFTGGGQSSSALVRQLSPRRQLDAYSPSPLRSREVSPSGSPSSRFRSPRTGRANEVSAQHLIYHCMGLLKNLNLVVDTEPGPRREIEHEEQLSWSILLDLNDYLSGGRVGRANGGVIALQLDEAYQRQRVVQECAAFWKATAIGVYRSWTWSSRHREHQWSTSFLLLSEAESRNALRAGEDGEWMRLVEHEHDSRLADDANGMYALEVSKLNEVVALLQDKSLRLASLEPLAARCPQLAQECESLKQSLRDLSNVHDECMQEHAALGAAWSSQQSQMAALHARLRVEQTRAFVEGVESSRARISSERDASFLLLVQDARAVEMRQLRKSLQETRELRALTTSQENQVNTLENLALKLQHEVRDAELSVVDHRSLHRRTEDEVYRLTESLNECKKALSAADERFGVSEMELVRMQTRLDQCQMRLRDASQLAEDTFRTVLEQQNRIKAMQHTEGTVKEIVHELLLLAERDDLESGSRHIADARRLLRGVQSDLSAARRAEGAEWTALESNMVLSSASWHQHADYAERAQSTGESGPLTSGHVQAHVYRAFHAATEALELLGPSLDSSVLIVDRHDMTSRLRMLIHALAATR